MPHNRPVSVTGQRWPAATVRGRLRGAFGDASRGEDPRLVAFAAFALFTGFAGEFWRNLTTWWGFGAVVLLVLAGALVVLARKRPWPHLHHLPAPLLLLVSWCLVSVAWSMYRPETLLASAIQIVAAIIGLALACSLTMSMLLRALSLAMRAIVALSLVFEFIVAVWFPGGVLPLYLLAPGALARVTGDPNATPATVPGGFEWSQANLFEPAAIQGIVGNRNLLAMVALLMVIAVGVQWASRTLGRWNALVWIAVGVGTMLKCRSMTALAAAAVVVFAVLLIRIARPLRTRQRWAMYVIVAAVGAIGTAIVVQFNAELFGLINRSSDLSGRGDIWWAVTEIAREHPVTGIGWISYWAPWVEPFRGLLVIDGIQYLQAHNAYIDMWMQTGLVGAGCFTALVLTTLIRTWWLAIDREQHANATRIPPIATFGFLVMVALAVQSLTESRLLIEGNFLVLCCLAISSKLRVQDLPALPRRTLPALTGPITVIDRATHEPRPIPPDSGPLPKIAPVAERRGERAAGERPVVERAVGERRTAPEAGA